jgi:predicted amidohydrolase YtcJ
MSCSGKNLFLAVAAIAIIGACEGQKGQPQADLFLTNAYVYTVDEGRSVAEAVAIRGNEIVYVGNVTDAQSFIGESTEVRDLKGAMLMPGLHDMHIHALGTVEPDMCDLKSESLSLEEMVPVLKNCITDYEVAAGDWLIVLQWSFSGGNQPSEALPNIRAALDAVSPEHPIFLWGDDGHHGAANSLAFSMAVDPDGQGVEINAESLRNEYEYFRPMIAVDARGEPSGGINEDARLLVRPNFLGDMLSMSGDLDATMPRVAAKMAANGITSLQDAIVTPETLAAYGQLEKTGKMTFRLRAAMVEPESERIDDIDAHLELLSTLRDQYDSSELISANAVKLFADAVLEGNPLTNPPTLPVAEMIGGFKQPVFSGSIEDGSFDIAGYVDPERETCQNVQEDPDSFSGAERVDAFLSEFGFHPQQCIPQKGILEHEEAFIRAYIRKATEAGFHVHVHALADKGVRVAVDELGKVKNIADRNGTTQSLAHVQIAHPDDQKRIGELGISVVFTFVWATPGLEYDMMVVPFIEEVDGIADLYDADSYYMQNVYPARTIQDFGGILVNGSDAPVGSRNPMPFSSLQQAITRSNGDVVLNAAQRVDVHSAIAAFTINGAKLFDHDDQLGSIEVGKKADLIVLSQNIVELASEGRSQEIANTTILLTVFDGQVVYEMPQGSE